MTDKEKEERTKEPDGFSRKTAPKPPFSRKRQETNEQAEETEIEKQKERAKRPEGFGRKPAPKLAFTRKESDTVLETNEQAEETEIEKEERESRGAKWIQSEACSLRVFWSFLFVGPRLENGAFASHVRHRRRQRQ